MQNIIVVQQGDILAGGHFQALVGVAGDPLVVLQHLIFDTRILLRVSLADLTHVDMLTVAAVRQTQLPVLVSLSLYAVQKLCQELLRRIVKRRQNTELNHPGKYGLTLGLRFLRTRKAGSAVTLHILSLLKLTANLSHNARDRTIACQTISGFLIEMKTLPEGNRQLPGKAALDTVQLEIQLLNLFFGLLDFTHQDLGLFPFCLVKFFIIHLFLIHILLHNFPRYLLLRVRILIGVADFLRLANHPHVSPVNPDGFIADFFDLLDTVGHKKNRGIAIHHFPDTLFTFILELIIADRQNLVDDQNVRVYDGRDGKSKAGQHTG